MFKEPAPPCRSVRTALAVAVALSCTGLPMRAGAQDVPADANGAAWGLGAGVLALRKPYAGADTEYHALPLLMYETRWIGVAGMTLGLKLMPPGALDLRLIARYRHDGYEADDAAILHGMQERKYGIWVGPQATWHGGAGDLAAEWTADASGHSKGRMAKVTFAHGWRSGALEVQPRVALGWADANYVDYYYGVKAGEYDAGRPVYGGRASTMPELGLRLSYAAAPRQLVFVDASVGKLGSGIGDSPLVGRTNQAGISVGYLYRF